MEGLNVRLVLFGALALTTTAYLGYRAGVAHHRAELLQRRVHQLSDVQGSMSPAQSALLENVLQSGAEVLQERIGNLTTLLIRAGGESFEELFVVPTAAAPLTLAGYRKANPQGGGTGA